MSPHLFGIKNILWQIQRVSVRAIVMQYKSLCIRAAINQLTLMHMRLQAGVVYQSCSWTIDYDRMSHSTLLLVLN